MNQAATGTNEAAFGPWSLNQQAFDAFLSRLDNDRERAGEMYEGLRKTLIRQFSDSPDADRWADETLDRAIRKNTEESVQNMRAFVFAIARRVRIEMHRNVRRQVPIEDASTLADNHAEKAEERLDKDAQLTWLKGYCDSLPPNDREFLVSWYAHTGSERITHRKRLASHLGVAGSTLRVLAFRHRKSLLHSAAKNGFYAVATA